MSGTLEPLILFYIPHDGTNSINRSQKKYEPHLTLMWQIVFTLQEFTFGQKNKSEKAEAPTKSLFTFLPEIAKVKLPEGRKAAIYRWLTTVQQAINRTKNQKQNRGKCITIK